MRIQKMINRFTNGIWIFGILTAIALLTGLMTPFKTPLISRMYQSAASRLYESDERSDLDMSVMSVDQRRRLAKTISDITREIGSFSDKNYSLGLQWQAKLSAIAGVLDARLVSPSNPIYSSTMTLDEEATTKLLKQTHDGCFSLCSLLTAILPATKWKSTVVEFVIEEIRKSYDIPIIAIVQKGETIHMDFQNVTVIEVLDENETRTLNLAIESIATPFVLMGLSLSAFNSQISLERLIKILLKTENVKVVGGAAIDLQGSWMHGCLQQRMAAYQAQYRMGFYHSRYECMYCDDILTPFVANRDLMAEIPFSEDLASPVLYRDWLAKVKERGYLAMSCPDVTFFVSSHVSMNRVHWHAFAKKWLLEDIHSYNNELYSFNCESIGITCLHGLNTVKQYILPRCCRLIAKKYLANLHDFAVKNSLTVEFYGGQTVGAVKMGGYLPWDFDIDVIVECKDYKRWFYDDYGLQEKCIYQEQVIDAYFTIFCPAFFIDVSCYFYNESSQQYLPAEYKHIPTVIDLSERNFTVASNPGLINRNMYGFEVLRHYGHYKTLKPSAKSRLYKGSLSPGIWNRCERPEFHSCLDHFPGDGNLPFLEPFLNLW